MKRLLTILVAVVVLLSVGLWTVGRLYVEACSNVSRLRSNQQALLDTIARYSAQSGVDAYQISRLTVSRRELRKLNSDLKADIADLRIKLKTAEAATRVTTVTRYVIKPDTVWVSDKPHYRYADAWLSFSMDTAGVYIASYDTVRIVRHQTIRRFLWWVRKRDKHITVSNSNPHTQITTIQSIDIQ